MSYHKYQSITFEGIGKNFAHILFLLYISCRRHFFIRIGYYPIRRNQKCIFYILINSAIIFLTNRIFSLEHVLAFDTLMLSNDTFRAVTIDIQAEKYCLVIV